MQPARPYLVAGLLWTAWLAAAAAGFAVWERYDATPGAAGPAADAAPTGRWELVLFAHPHCPCTRAALAELAELAHDGPGLAVRVVYVRPPGAPDGWERTGTWDDAAAVPGIAVTVEAGEAARAGAKTSGYAVLYDPHGRVAFRGGVTRARGRAGDSPGRRAVLDILAGREPEAREAPAFGCPLFGPDDCAPIGKETTCPR
jgi:hypothetical protein